MPDWLFWLAIYGPLFFALGVAADVLLVYRAPPNLRGD